MMASRRTWPAGRLACAAALVWSSPVGLAGVVGAFLFAVMGWGSLQIADGTLQVVARGPVARWFGARGWAAFTLGWTIWFWGEEYAGRSHLVWHERAHVRQYLWLGPLMPLVYPMAGLYAVLRGGHFYRDNAFEAAARKAARQWSRDVADHSRARPV